MNAKALFAMLKNRWWMGLWIALAALTIFVWLIPASETLGMELPLIKPSNSENPWILGLYAPSRAILNCLALSVLAVCLVALRSKPQRWNITGASILAIGAVTLMSAEGLSRAYLTNWSPPHIIFNIQSKEIRHGIAIARGYPTVEQKLHLKSAPAVRWQPNAKFSTPIQTHPGIFSIVKYTLDSEGLNNPLGVIEENPRIIAVGDSFTFGVVPREFNWVSQLSDTLGEPVANLGVSGSGPQAQIALFEKVAKEWDKDLVIWQFFGNDLADALLFDTWERLYNGLTWTTYRARLQKGFGWEESNAIKSVKDRFWLYAWISSLTHLSGVDVQKQQKIEILPGQEIFYPHDQDICDRSSKPEEQIALAFGKNGYHRSGPGVEVTGTVDESLNLIEGIFDRLEILSQEQNFRVLILYSPWKGEVYTTNIADHLRNKYPDECMTIRPEQLGSGIQEWLSVQAADRYFDFLDLTKALRDATEKHGVVLYYPLDPHFNTNGEKAVAEALSEFLGVSGFR